MKRVVSPHTLEELWQVLEELPKASLMAGGTDLLVHLRDKGRKVDLILLERIAEMQHLEQQDGELVIGAMVTHQQLLDSPIIKKHLPVLAQAVSVLGSPPIRHMATIGGNICSASPAGDSLPPLYLLEAKLVLKSKLTSRTVPIQEFILGPSQTVLAKGEILAEIRVPVPAPISTTEGISTYYKVGQRKALAISIVSMAACLEIASDRTVRVAKFAWGSVGSKVMVFPELDKYLFGKKLTDDSLRELGMMFARQVTPITDLRASAEHRRALVSNLPLKLLAEYKG